MAAACSSAADPEARGERIGAGEEAAGKAADQRGGEADALDDRGIFVARKSEIDDERRRHRAGQRVGELEQHDEGEHHERQLARQEIRERADRGLDDALQRLFAGVRGFGLRAIFPARSRSSVVAMPISTSTAMTA